MQDEILIISKYCTCKYSSNVLFTDQKMLIINVAMQQAGQTVRLIGQEKKEQLAITYGEGK